MATDHSNSASKWIRAIRLAAAFLLTPVVLLVWTVASLDAVMAHFGMHPDGPGKAVTLFAIVIVIGFAVPFLGLLCLGIPYVVIMLDRGRLRFLAVVMPSLPLAAIHALFVYLCLQPGRYPVFARTMALISVPGVILSGLCFYVIGVWRLPQKRPDSRADLPAGA